MWTCVKIIQEKIEAQMNFGYLQSDYNLAVYTDVFVRAVEGC